VVGGVFLFGYFILDKQNKVTRLEAKKNIHTAHCKQVHPTTLATEASGKALLDKHMVAFFLSLVQYLAIAKSLKNFDVHQCP
jgi:hypothetical protein